MSGVGSTRERENEKKSFVIEIEQSLSNGASTSLTY